MSAYEGVVKAERPLISTTREVFKGHVTINLMQADACRYYSTPLKRFP